METLFETQSIDLNGQTETVKALDKTIKALQNLDLSTIKNPNVLRLVRSKLKILSSQIRILSEKEIIAEETFENSLF